MFFECKDEGCDKLFGSKKALNEHERTHQVNRPFKWYDHLFILRLNVFVAVVQYANSDLYNFRASVSTREFMTNLSPLSARSRVVESPSPR